MAQTIARTSQVLTVNTTDQTFTFPTDAVSYLIWSSDVELILEEDNAIDDQSYHSPVNVVFGPARVVRVLHYACPAGTGPGTAYLKWLPRGTESGATEDWREWNRRGGVQIGVEG